MTPARSTPPPRPGRRRARLVLAGLTATLASVALTAPAALAAPPANDTFANAAVLEVPVGEGTVRVDGSTVEATRDPSDPKVTYTDEASPTVWYRLTPTTARRLVITTCDPTTDFDTVLGLYAGTSPTDLRTIARNDDDGNDAPKTCSQGTTSYPSSLVVTLQANVTYYVMVAGYSTGSGRFGLQVRDDRTAPSGTIVSGPAEGATVPAATQLEWEISSTEDSRLACTVDGIAVDDCDDRIAAGDATNVNLDRLCNGVHTVAFTLTDMAGNVSVPLQRTVTVAERAACAAPEFIGTPRIAGRTATLVRLEHEANVHRTPTSVRLEYGTTTAYGRSVVVAAPGVWEDATTFEANLQLLAPDTTYHARWVATNSAGQAVSVDFTFTTDAAVGPAPIAILNPITDLTPTTAILHGFVADGTDDSDDVSARFEYGTTPTYGTDSALVQGFGRTQSAALAGLQPNTTYHYRLVAATGDQLTVTPDATFTTPPLPSGEQPPVVIVPDVVVPPVVPSPPASTTPVTRKQITADLRTALRRAKAGLSRKRLRRGGTVTVTVRARSAGSIRISGALRRSRTTVTNAVSGTVKAKRAGNLKLRLKITKRGRALARKRGTERLTLKASWKPAKGKAITVTQGVKLKG